jgi:hypothetical protein
MAEVGVVMLLDRALGGRRGPLAEQREQRIPSRTFQEILTFAGNGAQASIHSMTSTSTAS